MKNIKLERIREYHQRNLGKIVLLLLVVVFFTITIAYIPYLNILLRPMGILISLFTFYLLFPLPTKFLIYIAAIVLFFIFTLIMLKLNFMVDLLGNLLLLLLVAIVINYGKDIDEREKL